MPAEITQACLNCHHFKGVSFPLCRRRCEQKHRPAEMVTNRLHVCCALRCLQKPEQGRILTLQCWCKGWTGCLGRMHLPSTHHSPRPWRSHGQHAPRPGPHNSQTRRCPFVSIHNPVTFVSTNNCSSFSSPHRITANIEKQMTLKCLLKSLSAVPLLTRGLHYAGPFSGTSPVLS